MSHSPTDPTRSMDRDGLRAAIRDQAPAGRVCKVVFDGAIFWVKRREHHTLRWRLQKGDPAAAFERERHALRDLRGRDLPVAEIIDEGPDYFVLRDGGTPLSAILADQSLPPGERQRAFAAAADTLLALHEAGIAHGRPSLRDMLWDGQRVTLIDFERFSRRGARSKAQANDLLAFLFDAYRIAQRDLPEIEAALARYRAADHRGIWSRAQKLVHRRRWLARVAAPLRRLMPATPELLAVMMIIDRMAPTS